ncbi:MAG TPA: hypothetical protein VGN61_03595 [Verrucomicrobiae bacterium]
MYCGAMLGFNLERAIEQWRKQMAAAGIYQPKTLAELENHLREEFHRRVAAGADAERAFADAATQLGNAAQLRGEFGKVSGRWPVPALAGVGILLVSAVCMGAYLRGWFGWVLDSHIVTLTMGYEAALLCGCFALAWVVCPRNQFARDAMLFARVATVFVPVGLALGYFVKGPNSEIGTMEMHGALRVAVWFAGIFALKLLRPPSDRIASLLCLGGSVIVTVSWFWPYVVERPLLGLVWPVSIGIGIQLVALAAGMTLRREKHS